MKLIKFIKDILTKLYLSIKRFPLTILLSASIFAILIVIQETNTNEETLPKIALVLALGIPISLCIRLFFERRDEENSYKAIIAYLGGGVLLILYYFIFLNNIEMVEVTRYIAVNFALYLAFLFIPYFFKKDQFEMYIITLVIGFFITVLYSIVLFLGLSAILFTVDKLLGIIIEDKIYFYTWLFVVFIFAVLHFLKEIPYKHQKITVDSYPKLLKILLLYIVIPLLTVYTVILYIYFGKIIVTWQWPMGMVSNLVLWYSVIVTILLFCITPIREEIGSANKFLKFAPKIILPLLIMLFISIGLRINAYGVTESRYFVVILALWVFFIMLYFCFTKKLRNIIIPITLFVISIISVFGPISSYSISNMSQNNRLEQILERNKMIKNGKAQSSTDISSEDRESIMSILYYFDDKKSLKYVKCLPENFKLDEVNKVFGFPNDSKYTSPSKSFYFVKNSSEKDIDIKGYDYLIDMENRDNGKNSNSALNVSYNYESATIKINYENKDIYSKNLKDFVETLNDKHLTQSKTDQLTTEEMTMIDENEKIKVKFVFLNISGSENKDTQSVNIDGINYYMFVKIK